MLCKILRSSLLVRENGIDLLVDIQILCFYIFSGKSMFTNLGVACVRIFRKMAAYSTVRSMASVVAFNQKYIRNIFKV